MLDQRIYSLSLHPSKQVDFSLSDFRHNCPPGQKGRIINAWDNDETTHEWMYQLALRKGSRETDITGLGAVVLTDNDIGIYQWDILNNDMPRPFDCPNGRDGTPVYKADAFWVSGARDALNQGLAVVYIGQYDFV